MFKLLKKNCVQEWPATASIPIKGGKIAEKSFSVDLVILDTDAFHQAMREGDESLMKQVVTGWQGLGDEQGKPLVFNSANLSAAAKNPYFAKAVIASYLKASSGQASEKN